MGISGKNRIIITLKGNFVWIMGILTVYSNGVNIMIKLGDKGCIRYPGGTGISGING
jgi:hypothetical protein